MAFPTDVNDEIMNSVTQPNPQVIGDAPAIAMGNLFIATSQALSNAAHNATNNQQQSYVTMQAATTQAVTTLYSVDTASVGVATREILNASVAGTAPAATALTPQEIASSAAEQTATLKATASDSHGQISDRIEEAIDFALHTTLGSAERFNHAVREVMDAHVSSLQAISESQYRDCLNSVKIAAISKTLEGMLKHPEKHALYAEILTLIEEL